jgi:hypothetical protein
LASNTKKREGKAMSSLGVFFNLVIFFFAIFTSGVAVPRPRVFHSWKRKREIDDGLGGLKTHRCMHLVLALLKHGKSLSHLLV